MMQSTSRSRASRMVFALAIVSTATIFAACDDDPAAPTMVVADNTTLNANATVVSAVAGVPFSFPAGAGALAPAVAGQNLALTFGGTATAPTATMVITTAAGATTGTITTSVTFGSCIFAVTSSTFPAGHALSLGQTVTVNPCNMRVGTAGAVANGVATSRSIALVLGAAASSGQSVTVAVTAGGQLTLNGSTVGTVTLTPVSG
jgi:hypothetical protein